MRILIYLNKSSVIDFVDISVSKRDQNGPHLRTETTTKKVLVLEDPTRHRSEIISYHKESARMFLNLDLVVTRNITEAHSELNSSTYEMAIIHHSDFNQVQELRNKHPNVKFISYSALALLPAEPGTLGEELRLRWEKHYDAVMSGIDAASIIDQIKEVMKKLNIQIPDVE